MEDKYQVPGLCHLPKPKAKADNWFQSRCLKFIVYCRLTKGEHVGQDDTALIGSNGMIKFTASELEKVYYQ